MAMYAAFGRAGFRVTHLALTPQPNVPDIRKHLLGQDIIWVAGGSVVNPLAVWALHSLVEVLRECWQSGVVLMGVSAGSLCWFVCETTDSRPPAAPGNQWARLPALLQQPAPRQRAAAVPR